MAEMLTVKQLREKLKLSRQAAYDLCKRTDFPVCRIGRKILIPADSLQKWISNGGTANDTKAANHELS